MKKIKDFLVNLCKKIKNSYKHQRFHVFIGVIVPLFLWIIGFSFILSLLCGALAGLLEEIIYCYAPLKSIKVWKWYIKVPDFKKWKEEFKNGSIKTKHSFENENYKYNFVGLFAFVIIIILLKLL